MTGPRLPVHRPPSAPSPLTPRQEEVLATIRRLTIELQRSPKLREIAEAVDLAGLGGITEHLDRLVTKGRIVRQTRTCTDCGRRNIVEILLTPEAA